MLFKGLQARRYTVFAKGGAHKKVGGVQWRVMLFQWP